MKHILYRIYQILIGYPIFGIVTVLMTVSVVVGCAIGDARFWSTCPPRWWSKATVRGMLLPVNVTGLEKLDPNQSYVFVANHQGFFDIFLVYGYLCRDIKWMMKWQIAKWPLVGLAARKGKEIIVDKRSRAAIKKTYEDARDTLKGGVSVVLFPEGRRSHTGRMGEFQRGGFALADELQLPVVPLTINGSFKVMSRYSKWTNWFPLRLTIHDPILPLGRSMDNQKHAMSLSRELIMSALDEDCKGDDIVPADAS